MKVDLVHTVSGATKKGILGFSWTSLFFGPLVPLFRGDLKWLVIHVGASLFSLGIFYIIFPFIYNKLYTKSLLESGYKPANDQIAFKLSQKGLINLEHYKTNSNVSQTPPPIAQPQTTQSIPQNQESLTDSNLGGVESLRTLVKNKITGRANLKQSYYGDNIPQEILDKISKKFSPINVNREKIIFAGVYGGKMGLYGVILTEDKLYWRLAKGAMALAKTGVIPYSVINTIGAKHAMTHQAYRGGNPGPEISVNGDVIGFFQSLMVIKDADQDFLEELFTEINDSGILTTL
jgi:hypothetical protein